MTQPQPTPEHLWLQKLLGTWHFDQGPEGMTGTETVTAIGDLWIQGHSAASCGPMAMSYVVTLGFDPERKKFVGTWVGSMMTFLWVYEGELDTDGKTLVLSATGPSMKADGAMLAYRDVITLLEDGSRTLTSFQQGADGVWNQFMSMTLTRAA
jgi:hypothetical protein